MPSFTEADVRRLARLARLELTDDEVARFTRQLCDILEFARQVQAVDTPPGDLAADHAPAPLRADAVQPSLSRQQALSGAAGGDPATGLFKVPRVLGES